VGRNYSETTNPIERNIPMREIIVNDVVSTEDLARIRALARLAADQESAGSFASAAEAQLNLARLCRFTGDITAADAAYQRSAELVVRVTQATATDGAVVERGESAVAGAQSGKAADNVTGEAQFTGAALCAYRLTHGKRKANDEGAGLTGRELYIDRLVHRGGAAC
jgi:hypothetical protein